MLKVDFAEQVGLSRVEGKRIVTEFRNRDEVESGFDPEDLPVCCEWAGEAPHMVCVQLCEL
ncbi:hypothetical protein ACIRBY_16135 [Streptomyces sp. NPDC096136]|uniref:hypothetical protein n=1 Tax=Streptomyces sp. NPDC096136 TaxID=3366076 RepID=UPI00381D8D9A